MTLYSEEDFIQTEKLKKVFLIKIAIATALYAAAIVISSVTRISWPGYAASAIWAFFVVFLWGTQGIRIHKYLRFLRDINQGLEKSANGTIISIDTAVTTRELVDFYTVLINDSSAEDDSPPRKLYFDTAKGLPPFSEKEKVNVILFDNHIKGFERI